MKALESGFRDMRSITQLSEARHVIPFKAKAWLDLSQRKDRGEQVDSRNIRKHKNDVFRLTELLDRNMESIVDLPETIKEDFRKIA